MTRSYRSCHDALPSFVCSRCWTAAMQKSSDGQSRQLKDSLESLISLCYLGFQSARLISTLSNHLIGSRFPHLDFMRDEIAGYASHFQRWLAYEALALVKSGNCVRDPIAYHLSLAIIGCQTTASTNHASLRTSFCPRERSFTLLCSLYASPC